MKSSLAQRENAPRVACEAVAPVRYCERTDPISPQFDEEQCAPEYILDVLDHRFAFLGDTYELGDKIDWLSNPSVDVEWQIMLHKFYFAPGLARQYVLTGDTRYRDCFEELLTGWIAQTDPGFIATDVTARRVQNWVYAWHIFSDVHTDAFSAGFRVLFFDSLEIQIAHVIEHMAPARNHRTMSLFAVFLASIAFPEFGASPIWRQFATEEMLRNIRTDLLADGVHCELSTDYHHIVLRSYLLFLQLAAVNNVSIPNDAKKAVCRALVFAMHIHRPDGNIPALSDSDSKSYLALLAQGADFFNRDDFTYVASKGRLGHAPVEQHVVFDDGGYVVLRSNWTSEEEFTQARYLVFDAGPIGAGNHGHLDALSIEVAAYGRPLIVDPGRYTYDEKGSTNWRARFRGTSAHNTVTVNQTDQATYERRQNGGRKVIFLPRPEASLQHVDFDGDCAYVHGYVVSPKYSAVHHRHIWFSEDRYWVILDQLVAQTEHSYDLRYQFTRDAQDNVSLEAKGDAVRIGIPGMAMLIAGENSIVRLESSYVSPTYGIRQSAPRICMSVRGATVNLVSVLYPDARHAELSYFPTKNGETRFSISDRNRHDIWRFNDRNQSVRFESGNADRAWDISAVIQDGQ